MSVISVNLYYLRTLSGFDWRIVLVGGLYQIKPYDFIGKLCFQVFRDHWLSVLGLKNRALRWHKGGVICASSITIDKTEAVISLCKFSPLGISSRINVTWNLTVKTLHLILLCIGFKTVIVLKTSLFLTFSVLECYLSIHHQSFVSYVSTVSCKWY